jgi:hypothetical protein
MDIFEHVSNVIFRIFIGVKNVLNESVREKLNTYHVVYTFSISLTVFKMVKQKGVNVALCVSFLACFFCLNFVIR